VLLSVTVYDRSGTSAVAILGAVRTVPSAVAGPVLSLVADRVPRVRILVIVLAAWSILVAVIPAAISGGSLLPVYLLVGATSISGTVLRPAMNALVPQLIDDPRELSMANSTYSLTESVGALLGPLVAGGLVAAFAPTARYLTVAAIFAVAAIACVTVRTSFKPPFRLRGQAGLWRRVFEPLAGFPILIAQPRLRSVFAVCTAQTVTRGALNVLIVGLAASIGGRGLGSTGLLFAAIGAGGVLGSVLTMVGSGGRPALSFTLGMSMWGIPLLAIAAYPHALVSWLALVVVGIGNAVGDVAGLTLFHRIIPDHLLGRAFGAFWAAASGAQAAGSAIAAVLVAWVGLPRSFLIVGAVMASIAFLSWTSIRTIDNDLTVDEAAIAALGRCDLLSKLTRVTLEHLTRQSVAVAVDTGSIVITQGEVGTAFFVIDSGKFQVAVNNQPVAQLGPGDCFGEIAAIRQIPRTATVIASEPGQLVKLEQADFVSAVTGHRIAEQAVLQLAEQREPVQSPGID
jgi:MFS family permease